jgi:hypothetical protein
MPELIDTIYVHRAVDEGDIPPRHIALECLAGAPAAQQMPPGPWAIAVPVPAFPARSGVSPAGQRRVRLENDLTPIVAIVFIVWIALCCVYEVMG